jgi:DNA-binding transcriptional LysR family regulator
MLRGVEPEVHLALDVMLPAARDALKAKHMLLKKGIGWGNMPEPMVRDDIESGRLVQLNLPDCKGGPYRLQAVYRTDPPPGPAARFLIDLFQRQDMDKAVPPGAAIFDCINRA